MKYAFLFPGQGSQSPGMGKFLFDNFPYVSQIFIEASDSINLDLKKLCFISDEVTLALTENTQPAIITVSHALEVVLKNEFGITPTVVAGHSVGEYAALVAAGVIVFSDAIKAVRLRGQAMQSAVPVGLGSMIAVLGLNPEQALYLCRLSERMSKNTPLETANYNCDGQIVLSGNKKAIDWLKENYKPEMLLEEGLAKDISELRRVKLIPLQVSAPFHSSMMKPAEEVMAAYLNSLNFNDTKIPVIQNIDAYSHSDAKTIRLNLIKQISGSVLWTQSMIFLKTLGISETIEVGHGQVLKGLLKKIDGDFFVNYSCNSMDDLKTIAQSKKVN